MPDPGSEPGPVMVEKAIAHPRPILGWSPVPLPTLDAETRPERNVVEAYRVRRSNASRRNPPGTSRDAAFRRDWWGCGDRSRPEMVAARSIRITPYPGRTMRLT